MTLSVANINQPTPEFQAVTGAGIVHQIRVSGPVPAGCFLMLFDAVPTAPPYNSTPVASVALENGKPMEFGATGRPFSAGVYVAISGRADYFAPPNMSAQGVTFDIIYE